MIAIRASLVLGFFLAGIPTAPLLSHSLSELVPEKYSHYSFAPAPTGVWRSQAIKGDRLAFEGSASKLSAKPSDPSQPQPALFNPRPPIRDILEDQCQKGTPSGLGVPGFQPGTPKTLIRQMFGAPKQTLAGYWPNTTAAIYDLIPGEVSLGFLFDKDSELLRQTEVSFSDSIEAKVIFMTLNSLLGCRLNDDIKRGLQQVRLRESRRYYFSVESVEGVIERDDRDRLYIGIWEEDLH